MPTYATTELRYDSRWSGSLRVSTTLKARSLVEDNAAKGVDQVMEVKVGGALRTGIRESVTAMFTPITDCSATDQMRNLAAYLTEMADGIERFSIGEPAEPVPTPKGDDSNQMVKIGSSWPASRVSVELLLDRQIGDDGRSEWRWFTTPNGDAILGFYPFGDGFSATEIDMGEDYQRAIHHGLARDLEVDRATLDDYNEGDL